MSSSLRPIVVTRWSRDGYNDHTQKHNICTYNEDIWLFGTCIHIPPSAVELSSTQSSLVYLLRPVLEQSQNLHN